jgi:Binding-protein-dependent transport system inner membrane component
MLLGTQWYILFNVIAGAMAIPNDLKEAARVCRFGRLERWRLLILPGIFPHLVTGLVTAAGGAWNASIVAEYFHFKDQVLSTRGLGAIITVLRMLAISINYSQPHWSWLSLWCPSTVCVGTSCIVLQRRDSTLKPEQPHRRRFRCPSFSDFHGRRVVTRLSTDV